jgi:type IV pilus assembly protein PilA
MLRKLAKRGFTLIELMIVVAIIGILAAIAIPNFIRFQARSKQGEAKANLKAMFTAERSFFQEKDRYSQYQNEVGFSPERGNRYAYRLEKTTCASGAEDRSAATTTPGQNDTCVQVDVLKYTSESGNPLPTFTAAKGGMPNADPGVYGTCPSCNFMGTATGNIDNDAAYDSWFISSETKAGISSACGNNDSSAPGGSPYNTYNDVNCQ